MAMQVFLEPPEGLTELIWRLSVEQYHEMIERGILTEDDPVELLEGWLVRKRPKNPPHDIVTLLTRDALARLLTSGFFVNTQTPVTLRDSEPEPDLLLVRGEPRQYLQRIPGPRDVALLIEVADATLRRDRGWKKRLYARAGIAVYWIVNLPERCVEVYTQPAGEGEAADYARSQRYGEAETLPVLLDGRELGSLRVRDLLP